MNDDGRESPAVGGTLDQDHAELVARLFAERTSDYSRFQKFYNGDQAVELTDRMRRFLRVSEDRFNANFCAGVVDTQSNRLRLNGFDGDDDEALRWVTNLWRSARVDLVQHDVHEQAAIKGDAWCIVEVRMGDDGRPRDEFPRLVFNEPDLIRPKYADDEPDTLEWVAKRWVHGGIWRLNIYFADRIERYDGGRATASWTLIDEPQILEVDGEPLGVPVFHFRNRRLGNSSYGRSELESVIPLQNALNKALVDLLSVADTMGFQSRWTSNVAQPPSGFRTYPGAVWHLRPLDREQPVSVGQFPAEDPTGLIRTSEHWAQLIAAVSDTPAHLLLQVSSASFASGEALKTAEAGLVQKIEARQLNFGETWESIAEMAGRVGRLFDLPDVPDELHLRSIWRDPRTQNEKAEAEAIAVKVGALGIPKVQAWRELGYTPGQIAQMLEDEEAQRVSDSNIGAALLDRFSQGAA